MNMPRNRILVFLCLTFAFSSVFYYLSAQGSHYGYSLYLMWCPGVAGLITQWIFSRTLHGMGWQVPKKRYLLLSYGLPILYAVVVYGLVWLTGLGQWMPYEREKDMAEQLQLGVHSPMLLLILYILANATIGVVINGVAALGEEIGWRGFLVPELSRKYSFTATAIISGVIWALWHSPIILFSDYNTEGNPIWYGLACFTVMVVSSCFAYTWLRLKSGSLWTAVILHASHNAFIQVIFNPLTGNTGPTPYVIGEFGIGLALATVVIAFLFWQWRSELPVTRLSDQAIQQVSEAREVDTI
jgi:uncharacterized protein